MIDKDTKIFDDKSLSDVCRDIYNNSSEKRVKIEGILDSVKGVITNATAASMILPMIKEILDVSVRNDEQLVKLATIMQRFIDKSDTGNLGDPSMILPIEEKRRLLEEAKETDGGLTKEDIDNKVNNLATMVERAKEVIKKEEKKLIGLVDEKKD